MRTAHEADIPSNDAPPHFIPHHYAKKREIMRRCGYTMRLDTMTADDLREFHKYLVNEAEYYEHYPQIFDDIEERFKPRQLTENSINTIFRRIRTVVNWSLKHNIITNAPFATFETNLRHCDKSHSTKDIYRQPVQEGERPEPCCLSFWSYRRKQSFCTLQRD